MDNEVWLGFTGMGCIGGRAQPVGPHTRARCGQDIRADLVAYEHGVFGRDLELLEYLQEHRRVRLASPEVCRPEGGPQVPQDPGGLERAGVVIAGDDRVRNQAEPVAPRELLNHVAHVRGWNPSRLTSVCVEQESAYPRRKLREHCIEIGLRSSFSIFRASITIRPWSTSTC